jgi:hypothetical protein
VFFALLFVVFTCVFPYNHALNNPNENVRTYMTMAIVHDHTFAIDKVVERFGWVNDMAVVPKNDVPTHYSVKAPALGYAGVPVYWVFSKVAPRFGHALPAAATPQPDRVWWFTTATLVLRLFIVQLPCFAFLVWFERWLRHATAPPTGKSDIVLRLTTVAAVALGTNYLAYSMMFVSHALFAVASFASFGVITRERMRYRDARRRRASRALLAGFLAGLASLLEYQAFPISCGLAVYALTTFWRPTRLALFGLGAVVNAAALMFYQKRCFGNALTPGHTLTESQQFAQWHKQGFYGIVINEQRLKEIGGVFKELSLSHAFGFFGMSPFMWLGLLAVPFAIVLGYGPSRLRRVRRAANVTWLLMMLVLWVLISSALNWRGGWVVGPRFFGCAPPFFGFGALCALEWIARRGDVWRAAARAVAGGLALAGILEIGFVSLHFNSIPEDVTRPLAQVSLPLARAGFVPHHVGELVGVMSPWVWYGICGCMFAAGLLAVLLWSRDRWWTYAARLALVPLVLFVGVRPAFGQPSPEEGGDGGLASRTGAARGWEPLGRDRITSLRDQAERFGQRRPCNWYKLADVERIVSLEPEADRDERKAGIPRSECPR